MGSEPGREFNLVIPFVVCASRGGPYDDEAFAAGYQAGRIDWALGVLNVVGGEELIMAVNTALVPQLDLIAMHHRFTADSEGSGVEGWSYVTFRREHS